MRRLMRRSMWAVSELGLVFGASGRAEADLTLDMINAKGLFPDQTTVRRQGNQGCCPWCWWPSSEVTTVGSGGLISRNETVSLLSVSPSQTLTQFFADQAGFKGSDPGTIATSVPEPSSPVPIQE